MGGWGGGGGEEGEKKSQVNQIMNTWVNSTAESTRVRVGARWWPTVARGLIGGTSAAGSLSGCDTRRKVPVKTLTGNINGIKDEIEVQRVNWHLGYFKPTQT